MKTGNKRLRKRVEMIIGMVGVLLLFTVIGIRLLPQHQVKADTSSTKNTSTTDSTITEELTGKRSRFVKQYAMSDGSFTAVTYSMPVHFKKNGKWKEIDTTLVKSGKKFYKTKATDLSIKVTKKTNKKSLISLKRGKTALSIALNKTKKSKAKRQNPKKTANTDVLNQNTVTYKKVAKNTTLSYDIYPEKIQETLTVKKKQKRKSISFKINTTKLKVKVKGKKIYFKTKKGKTKYTRLITKMTDAKGVSSTKLKLKYNKKTGVLKLTPNKKWWNSKKRSFPMEVRTTYTTSKHSRDVKVGAAYAGAPNASFGYDKSLLVQANKCVAFTQMGSLVEKGTKDLQILDASLHIKSENTLKLGAGNTFTIGIHPVSEKWSGKTLTYNNRPAYEEDSNATVELTKKGSYSCDITDLVKEWYNGKGNYGVALVAENTALSYKAKLDCNPYVTVHYEIVGFDGAVELKENESITREVLASGQENYYYFDPKKDIAYDLYTTSTLDTQGILYDKDKKRIDFDDNSGEGDNFSFVQSYDGRRYLKVSTKGTDTGKYTLTLKKHFDVPEVVGIKGSDKYTLSWEEVSHAKEYVVEIYNSTGKIGEAVVTGTTYDYVYTDKTRGQTLGFTVTPRESKDITGEASRMVYNTDSSSDWVYMTPMDESRSDAMAVSLDEKIYVLGGENEEASLKTFASYDTKKQTWQELSAYPGTAEGIIKAIMVTYGSEIYVIGGQTKSGNDAKLLTSVYAYNTATSKWKKRADLSEGRTNLAYAVSGDEIYAFVKAGKTKEVLIYHLKTDTWESETLPDTSVILGAISVDDRIFALRETDDGMSFFEYLPDENDWEEASMNCPYGISDEYGTLATISGKIYLSKAEENNEVIVYDAYTDTWSQISDMNLSKENAALVASGNDLYSIGGEMTGFGNLDVVEMYSLDTKTTVKKLSIEKSESYELQVKAGNLKKGEEKTVTVSFDPDALEVESASSFEEEEELEEGSCGVTLEKYQPKKGVVVYHMTGKMEQGEAYQASQSIPLTSLIDGTTTVEVAMEEEK